MVSDADQTLEITLKVLGTYDGVERMGEVLLRTQPGFAGMPADIVGALMLAEYIDQILTTRPDPELWKTMHNAAVNHAIAEFRRTGREGGWSGVRAKLVDIGKARGWGDEIDQALGHASTASLNRMETFVENEAKKSGGCYVATAVYGSYDCPEVWVLRRFRDRSLARSRPGRLAISAYYATSPTLVRLLGERPAFTAFLRPLLDALVVRLHQAGFEQTPYSDLARGGN